MTRVIVWSVVSAILIIISLMLKPSAVPSFAIMSGLFCLSAAVLGRLFR